MPRNDKNLVLEDVVIAFRNFEGKEDTYNRAGDRNFAILLDEDRASQMERDGWNVKRLKPRDDDEFGQPYIQVAVSYKTRPPKIGVLTSKGLKYYPEELVGLLDWVDIETADVTLNPYEWAVNGKTGVKAYLQSLFLKIEEDYLQLKWESISEETTKQIESGSSSDDIIEGEFYVDQRQIGT
jgi:hypothetical protein